MSRTKRLMRKDHGRRTRILRLPTWKRGTKAAMKARVQRVGTAFFTSLNRAPGAPGDPPGSIMSVDRRRQHAARHQAWHAIISSTCGGADGADRPMPTTLPTPMRTRRDRRAGVRPDGCADGHMPGMTVMQRYFAARHGDRDRRCSSQSYQTPTKNWPRSTRCSIASSSTGSSPREDVAERDGAGGGDVEAVHVAGHRDGDARAARHQVCGQAGAFGAEDEGEALRRIAARERLAIGGRERPWRDARSDERGEDVCAAAGVGEGQAERCARGDADRLAVERIAAGFIEQDGAGAERRRIAEAAADIVVVRQADQRRAG